MNSLCNQPTKNSNLPTRTDATSVRDAAFDEGGGDSISELLDQARRGNRDSIGELLQQYRHYLTALAARQMDRRLAPRVGPSDVVQETMLRAHRSFAQFRGGTEQELLAWLRRILLNNLASFVEQHMIAARRDMRKDVSIDQSRAVMEESTVRLASLLPDHDNSPSMVVQHREEADLVADVMSQLSADYREVLVLRNLRQLSFEEISQRMNRSSAATRMLWLRAIEKLRAALEQRTERGPI